MTYVIAEPCIGVKDTACVDACPVDCIHPKKNTTYDDGRPTFDEDTPLYIDPIECIDCACVPVCPVSAIFALDDLPEKWKHFTEINASYVQGGQIHSRGVRQTPSSEIRVTVLSAPGNLRATRRNKRSAIYTTAALRPYCFRTSAARRIGCIGFGWC